LLERVRAFRAAARGAVRADAPARTVRAAIVDLVEAARAEEDPELVRWLERAIWEEVRGFFDGEPPRPYVPPEPVERACRGLLNRGYKACPTCRRDLPTELDFELWRGRRAAALAETRAREFAAVLTPTSEAT
jgi:hypothetical protein